MSSEAPREAYVWVWLPGAFEPVVAGRLDERGGRRSRAIVSRFDRCSLRPSSSAPWTVTR